jgi:uncharacterized membrane protein YhhN
MKTRIVSVLYFLSGIAFILLKHTPGVIPQFLVKAILIPFLILIFIINIRPVIMTSRWILFFALFFSWAGDVVLELPIMPGLTQQNEILFMIGLLCFMMTHILYFSLFLITPGRNYTGNKFFLFLLLVIIYGAGLLYYLMDDLGEMRIPVIVYTIVLLAMLAAAISRYKKVSSDSYILVVTGAVLFVLSDSFLAINKFSHPFKGSSALIMSTYLTGQFLIVIGCIKQYGNKFT